jgi:c-di-GMP-binding flagellar brake protein YcgR
LHLNVGDSLHMQIADAQDETQYSIRYLGALKGQSLMTTIPTVSGEAMWMKYGGKYIFRTLVGMYVYAFTSKVIKARAKPFAYAHFIYPESVHRRQVRRAARVKLNLPTLVRRPDGSQVAATLRDLSLIGVLVESGDKLGSVGDNLRVEFPIALDEVDKHLTLDATLRNSTGPDAGTPLRAGLEFNRLSNDDTLLLHYFIDHQIALQTL